MKKVQTLRLILPERFLKFICHDDQKYEEWKNVYLVIFSIPSGFRWVLRSSLPFERYTMRPNDPHERPRRVGLLASSASYIQATGFKLFVRATAYSCGRISVIKYLVLILPQLNEPETVTTDPNAPSDRQVFDTLKQKDPKAADESFFGRVWIHTHPRWRAFMSSIDIFQIYMCEKFCGCMLGIVISPRGPGV